MEAHPFMRSGRGTVPATGLVSAAWKELCEIPATTLAEVIAPGLGANLDFTAAGMTFERLRSFFDEAMAAAKKIEPICEAGNKYSVDINFQQLNGELLLHEIKSSAVYDALSATDRARADQFFELMCLKEGATLRNRNPLHPNPLDSAVIANLLNFPKHVFGLPFACYSTNGLESLSCVLFAYREQWVRQRALLPAQARVLYVGAEAEAPPPDIEACAVRLSMPFEAVTVADLRARKAGDPGRAAVIMCGFGCPDLEHIAVWAEGAGVGVHVHVSDAQIRAVLAQPAPVHFELPSGVRSMSLDNGFFRSGYQLYRDPELRDLHFDLPYFWESQYLSPNEGGSGNTTPLYIDFCMVLLGWSALRDAARQPVELKPTEANLENASRLQPRLLAPFESSTTELEERVPRTLAGVTEWAVQSMQLPREELERHVFQFQRHFTGGKRRQVEAITSGGGTRSINYAFESVQERARRAGISRMKVITGTPHLAVERAERRFLFQVVRVFSEGVICLKALEREIRDPCVMAVYLQTLSITDGITDPLSAALRIMEDENQRRKQAAEAGPSKIYAPVTLINDSCLAFSVLLHNDGERYGPDCLRVLDLTQDCITPTIMTQDAHKHLGADKGISMVMGTPGTLSLLEGHVKVGAQPTRGELVRAMADMLFVGHEGYHQKYNKLAAAVVEATEKIEAAGMHIIHGQNRARGSTAFGVEDPSALVGRMVKKKGHGPSLIYLMSRDAPERCQTGFLMSLTPHALREMRPGVTALDTFVSDLVSCHKEAAANPSFLARAFRENSLPAILIRGGNEESWVFTQLQEPGMGRDFFSVILRRLYSAIFDSGLVCTQKQSAPLMSLLGRLAGLAALAAAGRYSMHGKMVRRSKL